VPSDNPNGYLLTEKLLFAFFAKRKTPSFWRGIYHQLKIQD